MKINTSNSKAATIAKRNARPVVANKTVRAAIENRRKKIMAEEVEVADVTEVEVAPEVEGVLFEASEVAELIAEVVEKPVEVNVDAESDTVVFTVEDTEYTVDTAEAELVATRKYVNRKKISANRNAMARKAMAKRPVSASKTVARPVRAARPVSASRRVVRKSK